MSHYLVFPTIDSQVPQTGYDKVFYVNECFRYRTFDEAYSRLIAFDDVIRETLPSWNDGHVSYWRILVRHMFAMSLGNLKHVLPFIRLFANVLSLQNASDVTFVWPQEDVFTATAREMAQNAPDTKVSIEIDPTVINPTPAYFLGDSSTFPSATNFWRIPHWNILLLLGLLLGGKLLRHNKGKLDQHIIYSSKSYREITEDILTEETITVSSLRPYLVELFLSFRRNGSPDNIAQKICAEDILQLSSNRISALLKRFYQLYVTRHKLAEMLVTYLSKVYGGSPPLTYLKYLIDSLIQDRTFLKHYIYLELFNRACGIRSLTTLSGGINQEVLFELGKAYQVPIYDLNHTVLMLDPPEIQNRADKISIKGKPDWNYMAQIHPSDKLILTGRPYFDRLFQYYSRPPERHEHDLPQEMRSWNSTLMIATEPIRDEHLSRVLMQAFRATKPDGVCIKLHPKESLEYYQALINTIDTRDNPFVIVKTEYPLFDLMVSSQVVVTISSNVGLEALAIGIPAIHVDVPCNVPLYYQTLDFFKPYRCSLTELPSRIDELFEEGVPINIVEAIQSMYLIDGNCGQRLITKMYKKFDQQI